MIIDQPPARGLVFLPGLLVLKKLSILRFRRICSLKSTQKCYVLGIETKKASTKNSIASKYEIHAAVDLLVGEKKKIIYTQIS